MKISDRFAVLFVPALLAGCAGMASAPVGAPLSAADFERHIATLASDAFEGRKPGTAGERKTVDYLIGEFKRYGLQPGNKGSWTQEVPIVEITAGSDAQLRFGDTELAYGKDMVIWTKRVVPEVSIADSPMVFVGHGVVAPELGWNDYAGVDMRGKTAVILINDPGFATDDPKLFRGRAMTYYGRWTYKFEEAARQHGDDIFNGARDNATGTSALLTIARAFAESKKRPERTVVFLGVTLEESGLLGSAYYAANPVFPLKKTVAALNMDGTAFGGRVRDVSVIGSGASQLEEYLAAAAKRQDRVLKPEPTPEKGFFFRSDHFNLAKVGVPALYFERGIDDRKLGVEGGRAREADRRTVGTAKPPFGGRKRG